MGTGWRTGQRKKKRDYGSKGAEHVECEGQDWKLFLAVLGSEWTWVRVENLAAEPLDAGSAAEGLVGEHCKPCRGRRRVRASGNGRRQHHGAPMLNFALFCILYVWKFGLCCPSSCLVGVEAPLVPWWPLWSLRLSLRPPPLVSC